jgi:AcrR family transcriptional regulator
MANKKPSGIKPSGKNAGMKKSDVTRQRILDVAAHWFRTRGLAFTSLNDLAKQIEVKAASIYYYFDSKDALIEEVLRIGIELSDLEVRKAVAALGANAPYAARIRAAIHAHLNSLLSHGDYTSANIINYSHAPEHVREKNKMVRRKYGEYWKELLEGAQRAGEISRDTDLSLARMFLIGALNWAADWYDPSKKSVRYIADECYRLFMDGVGGRPAAATRAARAKPRAKPNRAPRTLTAA